VDLCAERKLVITNTLPPARQAQVHLEQSMISKQWKQSVNNARTALLKSAQTVTLIEYSGADDAVEVPKEAC